MSFLDRQKDRCYSNEKKVANLNVTSDISSEAANGIHAMLLLTLFLLLTLSLYPVYLWIRKYKLKYLFRISFLVYIFSVAASCISELFSANQERTIISLFFHKAFWKTAATASGSTCLAMLIIRYYWVMPINIISDDTENFSHLEPIAKSRRQTLQEMRKNMFRYVRRDSGQLNKPVYPNGWIPLIESTEVQLKKVVSVSAVGHKFCIYRGEEGKVFVTDAFCPHMGADLSAGGRVIGNCIECPFHAWQFSGETGKCTRIPYSDKIPDVAKVKIWKNCEKNGYVFIWHHAENEPPTYEIPSISEIENGEWVYRGRAEFRVHGYIQDIMENLADLSHFRTVHSPFVLFGPNLENMDAYGQWIQHHWNVRVSYGENDPHTANATMLTKLIICGFDIPYTRVNNDMLQIGPTLDHSYLKINSLRGVVLHHLTSEGPLLQRVVYTFYTEPRFRQSLANFFLWMISITVRRDIMVWNNKMFVKNPLLVKGESLIATFRRWYSQFYSEHSPSFKDLKEQTLDW